MTVIRLLKTAELAKELGLPHRSLVATAEKYGLIIQCGSAKRIRSDDINRLVEVCRKPPNPHDYISEKGRNVVKLSTTSGMASMNALHVLEAVKKQRKS